MSLNGFCLLLAYMQGESGLGPTLGCLLLFYRQGDSGPMAIFDRERDSSLSPNGVCLLLAYMQEAQTGLSAAFLQAGRFWSDGHLTLLGGGGKQGVGRHSQGSTTCCGEPLVSLSRPG